MFELDFKISERDFIQYKLRNCKQQEYDFYQLCVGKIAMDSGMRFCILSFFLVEINTKLQTKKVVASKSRIVITAGKCI